MTDNHERAQHPEDLTRLFVERVNAGDLDGVVALYEPTAVIAYPPGHLTEGLQAIRSLYQKMLAQNPRVESEKPLPTLFNDGLALTATRRRDGGGLRVQVARRQTDGSWLRILDWPEPPNEQIDT